MLRKYQKGNSREISKVIRLLAEEEEEEEGANSLFHSHLNLLEPLHLLSSLQKENRNEVSNNSELSKEERLAKVETYSGALLSIYLAPSFRKTGTYYRGSYMLVRKFVG